MEQQEQSYQVIRDGKMLFTGTYWGCFGWLLKHQSASVDWATKYEGYKIVPVESPKPDET